MLIKLIVWFRILKVNIEKCKSNEIQLNSVEKCEKIIDYGLQIT